jgi:hypothetical protein
MREKIENGLKYLSIVTLSLIIYNHIQNQHLNKITNELINERSNLNNLNSKYQELVENKINESEMEKIISNEKLKALVENMNLLKSKLAKQNELTESQLENINNSNVLEQLTDVKQSFKETNIKLESFINKLENYINFKNSNNFTDSFMPLIHDINNFIQTLTVEQNLALMTISASIFILVSMSTVISVFYDDYLITKLNLETRLPKLAKYIQLRRKFRQYYLLIHVLAIIIINLIIITVNIDYYFFYKDYKIFLYPPILNKTK